VSLITVIKWFLYATLTLVLVLFALSNREVIEVTLFPFDTIFAAPFFIIFFVSLVLGAIIGAAFGLLSRLKMLSELRSKQKEIEALSNEIAVSRIEERVMITADSKE
jgi:uncharacterized integral membrane protein